MRAGQTAGIALIGVLILGTAGCSRSLFGSADGSDQGLLPADSRVNEPEPERETIFSLFTNADDPNVTLEVNRYIWNATLDVLDFLPIQAADPFSGVLVYGFDTPPGGGRAYRATVYVQDPALDARSLRVALATRSGAAPIETVRAVEDAILTRARQLRIADRDL